jgi:single-strand DNA-binding protein
MLRNQFSGIGNLGADPERRGVVVGDEERSLVQFSVYFPNPVTDGNGSYKDKGGFWADVAVWSPSLGDQVMELLRKGTRVFVTGRLRQSSWDDGDGTRHQRLEIAADEVCLSLLGVQEFTRARPSQGRDASNAALLLDDEIPF